MGLGGVYSPSAHRYLAHKNPPHVTAKKTRQSELDLG